MLSYNSGDKDLMSFRGNAEAIIFMKSAGTDPDLWYATIDGKSGFVSNRFLRESRVFVKEPKHIIPVEFRKKQSEEVQPERVQQSHEVVEGTTIYSGEATSDNSQYDSTTLPLEASNEQSTPTIVNQDYADGIADQSPDKGNLLDENYSQQVTESSSLPIDYDHAQPTTPPPINIMPQEIPADYADALGPIQTAPENIQSQEHLNPRKTADQDLPKIEPLPTPQTIASGEASVAAQVPEKIDLLPQPLPPDSIQNVDYNVENNVSKDTLNSVEQQNPEYKDSYDKQQMKQEPEYGDALYKDYGQSYQRAENGQVQEPTIQTIPAVLPEDTTLPSVEVKDLQAVAETATQATVDETPVTVTESSNQEQTTIPAPIPQTPVDYILGTVDGNYVTPALEIFPTASTDKNQQNQYPDYQAQTAEYVNVTTETISTGNVPEDDTIDSTATPNENTESVSEMASTEPTTISYDQVSDYDSPTTESTSDDYRRNADDGINDASYIREDDEDHGLFSTVFSTLSNMWSTDAPPNNKDDENIAADVDQTENKVDSQSWYSFVYYLINAFNSQEETKALFASPGKCLLFFY